MNRYAINSAKATMSDSGASASKARERRGVGFPRLVATMVFAALLSACGDRYPDYSYRMTIVANGKEYSTVRHVTVEEGSTIQDSTGRRVDRTVEGQAVIIDTPSGPVFALMKPEDGDFGFGSYAARVAEPALMIALTQREGSAVERKGTKGKRGIDYLAGNPARHKAMLEVTGPQDLPRTIPNPDPYRGGPIHLWPMLVRFDALDKPESVRNVSADEIGISLISIEVTNEDAAHNISQILRWLPGMNSRYLNGSTAAVGSPFGLDAGAFSSEISQ